jgi:hypothetical protein
MTRNEDDVNLNVKGAFDGRRILSLNLSWRRKPFPISTVLLQESEILILLSRDSLYLKVILKN